MSKSFRNIRVRQKIQKQPYHQLFFPIALFLLLYPYMREIDLFFSSYSFNKQQGYFTPPVWCSYLYTWGLVPGQILFCVATSISFFGLLIQKIREKRIWRVSLYLFFVLALGSGIISHWLLKEHTYRPRPKQIQEFGGKYEYIKPFSYKNSAKQQKKEGEEDKRRSLPSGHATMGFYFLSLYYIGKRYNKKEIALFGILVGLFLGIALTFSRILQGGHFLSDGLVSFLVMWYTSFFLDMAWEKKK